MHRSLRKGQPERDELVSNAARDPLFVDPGDCFRQFGANLAYGALCMELIEPAKISKSLVIECDV